jgi:COP9 signalosome complex subunit 2
VHTHTCAHTHTAHAQDFYETTLAQLEKARNDRLWFKTNLKLVGLWFKMQEWGRMQRILKDLHK